MKNWTVGMEVVARIEAKDEESAKDIFWDNLNQLIPRNQLDGIRFVIMEQSATVDEVK